MTKPTRDSARHADDLRGLNRLVVDAITGTTDLVEAMHAAITHLPAMLGRPAPARTSGLTGWTYAAVRGVAQRVGSGVDLALTRLDPMLGGGSSGAERDALVAAVNGVLGDHLEASGNPLAIALQLRRDGRALPATRAALRKAVPDADGRIVVLLHGLCMNDRQWAFRGHDHGAALARDLGHTSVWLRYNSGRHIADNGADFAAAMEALVRAWPVPVERIALVCHSMGGLVARSACLHADAHRQAWRSRLSDIVFLGTPHHGAPLERLGAWIDRLLGFSPYSAPFTRLGRLRGAGIQDLRHGAVGSVDRGDANSDGDEAPSAPPPLPRGVRCHAIAGTTSPDTVDDPDHLRGDGLVPVASALGRHRDRAFDLRIPASRQWIAHGVNHLELLGSPAVYARIRDMLARPVRKAARRREQ